MDPAVTLLEIHKLMYFMQETGQNLRLNFVKGPYGPYSENLRHVLTHIEGHFITGYGDAADAPDKPINLLPGAVVASETFMNQRHLIHERFERVARLVEGFESPFGMELLATVHWVATREGATTQRQAVEKTHAWNARKRMFTEAHVALAWEVLLRHGFLPCATN